MAQTVIDFEGFAAGTVIGNQLSIFGITVFGDRNGSDALVNDAMIFDSDNITGGDDDLEDGDGKLLIVSEDNDSADPDDAGGGGSLTFTFDEAKDVDSVDIVDGFEGGFTITAFDSGGIQIGQVIVPGEGSGSDGDVRTILLNFANVSELVVDFNESGAVDNLVIDDPKIEFEKDISNIVAYLDCEGVICKIKFDDFAGGVKDVTESQIAAALAEAGYGDCDLLGATIKAGNNQNPEGKGKSVFGPGEGGIFHDFDTSDTFVTGTSDHAKVELNANDFDVFFA